MKDQLSTLASQAFSSGILYTEFIRECRRHFILAALTENLGNQSKAARDLGIHRNTLLRQIDELGIGRPLRETKATLARKPEVVAHCLPVKLPRALAKATEGK